MRKSFSAPNLNVQVNKLRNIKRHTILPPSPKTNHPVVYRIISLSHSKQVLHCKQIIVIAGTALMGYATYTQRIEIMYISNSVISITCVLNTLFSFIENYTLQLDKWRADESIYEEKTDPPLWNWKIVNMFEHTSIVLWLCGALVEDVSMFNTDILNMAFVIQFVALIMNVIDANTTMKIIKVLLCISSFFCFALYKNMHDGHYLMYGTILGVISETPFFLD
jgi:hypothetical protein